MHFLWLFIFAIQPYLVLPAVFGLFGKEAEEAATHFSFALLCVIVVVVLGLVLL